MYPLTKWCATFINTKSSSSGDYADDNLDVTSKIPSTNIYLPMDLEQNIMAEVEMYMDEEQSAVDALSEHKAQIGLLKEKEEEAKKSAEEQKVSTFMSFTGQTDREKARKSLIAHEWDLEAAAQKEFASSPNVMKEDKVEGGEGGPYQSVVSADKAVVRIVLPDNRQYTYQMDGGDTFWGVYGRLVSAVPELASKSFTFEMANGHTLSEGEFNQELAQAGLVPKGELKVKY